MQDYKLINKVGSGLAIGTLLFSFLLFFSDTREFFGSLSAAIMTAVLVWISYIILRWIYLAIWKP
jgi:hypothetical protein